MTTSLFHRKSTLLNAAFLAGFAFGGIPFINAGTDTAAKDIVTDGLPRALVLALSDTCLGGGGPDDNRPCDKGLCHVALSNKRKLLKGNSAVA